MFWILLAAAVGVPVALALLWWLVVARAVRRAKRAREK
jgi:hypothetical protein